MTIAGRVGDVQASVEMLRGNSALYKLDLARPIPINSAARLVSTVLFQSRYYPLGVQALIGGMDDTGGPNFLPCPPCTITLITNNPPRSPPPHPIAVLYTRTL